MNALTHAMTTIIIVILSSLPATLFGGSPAFLGRRVEGHRGARKERREIMLGRMVSGPILIYPRHSDRSTNDHHIESDSHV
jgi:hypothetical protein